MATGGGAGALATLIAGTRIQGVGQGAATWSSSGKEGALRFHQHLLHCHLRGLGNSVYVVDSMGTWRAALMDFFGMEGLYALRSPLALPADDAVDDRGFPVEQVSPCRTPTHRTSHLSPLTSHLSPGSCLLNRRRAAGPHHL